MWVLSTARAELHYFTDCAAVTGGYAILSHTWHRSPGREETFQDVQRFVDECNITGEHPRDRVGEKIRRFCQIAESDGYDWAWIDSCCIDKMSSTELSEAINSMFTWYALAEVCYVYLEDVPHADDPHAEGSKFRTARWHSRGWTLQELLAPSFSIFFSKEWKKIGTKYDLRAPLSECTGIDVEYLTREWDFRTHPSIARRMSWAAKRKTTRVEDAAYCLLGIFGINMPTLYGEGRHAFQRLQEELVKQSIDATLFVWGNYDNSSENERQQRPLSLIHTRIHNPDNPRIFLFAPSPSLFQEWSKTYTSPWKLPPPTDLHSSPNIQLPKKPKDSVLGQDHGEAPTFELTPYGMKCHFPVAEVNGITIAVLPCKANAERLGLLLHPAPSDETQVLSRQVYYVSWSFQKANGLGYEIARVTCLGHDLHNLRFHGNPVFPTWRDIYIVAHPPTTGRRDGAHLLQRFLADVAPTSFRIPRTLLQNCNALQFFPSTGTVSWDPASTGTLWLKFSSTASEESVRILLGTCAKAPINMRPCHWAWLEHHCSATWGQLWTEYAHNCATDHIEDWDDRTREFGDAERTIRLMFTPCRHAPERTLVLSLELIGSVYEEIQRNANVYLSPPVRARRRFTNNDEPSSSTIDLLPPQGASILGSIYSASFFATARAVRVWNAVSTSMAPPSRRPTDDMAAMISNLRDEIRTLRARDASREREVQELRSALAQLKESALPRL